MKIYRFEKSEILRLQNIKEGNLYMSHPEIFNDVDDCKMQGIFTPYYSKEYYKKLEVCLNILYSDANHYFPFPDEILNKLRKFFELHRNDSETESRKVRNYIFATQIVVDLRRYLRERTGVCCFFRGAITDSLMWAHYGDSHKGFCVEYEVEEDLISPLYPVMYTNNLPRPSISELLLCPMEAFIKILTSKSLQWSNENEYRMIYLNEIKDGESGKSVTLPPDIKPVRIITGAKFNKNVSDEFKKLFDSIDMDKSIYKTIS
jgi:hypothetical protein